MKQLCIYTNKTLPPIMQSRAVVTLVGLISRRSQVRILSLHPDKPFLPFLHKPSSRGHPPSPMHRRLGGSSIPTPENPLLPTRTPQAAIFTKGFPTMPPVQEAQRKGRPTKGTPRGGPSRKVLHKEAHCNSPTAKASSVPRRGKGTTGDGEGL